MVQKTNLSDSNEPGPDEQSDSLTPMQTEELTPWKFAEILVDSDPSYLELGVDFAKQSKEIIAAALEGRTPIQLKADLDANLKMIERQKQINWDNSV